MLPVDEVHHITEAAHHAIASSRDLLGFTVHQVIRIVTDLLCFSLFLLTETIAEPAHHEARFKGERLVLPYAGYGMTVYTDASVWIGLSAVGIKLILPEAATEYRGFTRLACADTDGAELTVTTADDDRCSLCEPGFGSALCGDCTCNRSAFQNVREDVSAQMTLCGDVGIPCTCLQIQETGGRSVTRLDGKYAGQLVNQPVVKHADLCGLFVNLREIVLYPQNTRNRIECIALTGFLIQRKLEIRVHPNQLRDFICAAGVDIGAGPDLVSVLIVQEDTLTHAGGRNRRDVCRIDTGFAEDVPDTATGQVPVKGPVEVHASWKTRVFVMRPLMLRAADLIPLYIEENRTYASGSGIDRH